MSSSGRMTQTEVVRSGDAVMPAKLAVLSGPDEGLEVALDGVAVIGSDSGATLTLSDRSASRRHTSVSVSDGALVVRDLGSRNGTFVGEVRVSEAQVPLGAVLRIGRSTVAIQPRLQVRELAPSKAHAFGELVGVSAAIREVFAVLQRAAQSEVPVLIEGESGTGKELAARAVHAGSARKARPYVVFDCAAVPKELAEAELFGHRRGAFSGAIADRTGVFQRANGGTICLDEIGELPLDLQPRLLRVLETSEVRPVGGDGHTKVDVRVVAATNRDLHAEVARGRFRADLLYRLDVVRVRMPPLRVRPEDLRPTAGALLQGKIVDAAAIPEGPNLAKLVAYGWPGNVRELRNVLARAVALAEPGRPLRFEDLVINLASSSASPSAIGAFPATSSRVPYKDAKRELMLSFDRAYLADLMERASGNVTKAAELSGLSRKHMYDLMKRVDEGRGEE